LAQISKGTSARRAGPNSPHWGRASNERKSSSDCPPKALSPSLGAFQIDRGAAYGAMRLGACGAAITYARVHSTTEAVTCIKTPNDASAVIGNSGRVYWKATGDLGRFVEIAVSVRLQWFFALTACPLARLLPCPLCRLEASRIDRYEPGAFGSRAYRPTRWRPESGPPLALSNRNLPRFSANGTGRPSWAVHRLRR
jgi:hypothetical protein